MAPTLRTLAAEYVRGRYNRGELTKDSARVIGERLHRLLDMYGDRKPAQLGRNELLEWQTTIARLAPATRRAYQSAVSKFCRWLVDEGHMQTDPAVRLARVKEPRRVPRTLTAEQVADVLACCPSRRSRAIISVMIGCGIRCVEVSNLDFGDVDLAAGTLLVKGKFGNERLLPIPDLAGQALAGYIAERGSRPGPLFVPVGSRPHPSGRLSARWISKRTAQLMRDAGVHQPWDGRSAHALRRTAASDVLERCGDYRAVQQMLGHRSLGTTEHYLRYADLSRLRQAMGGRDYMLPGPGDEATALRGAGSRSVSALQAPDPTEGPQPASCHFPPPARHIQSTPAGRRGIGR